MKDITLIEWAVISVIAVLLATVLFVSRDSGNKFEKACLEARGVAVHDGRQWQCLKPLT